MSAMYAEEESLHRPRSMIQLSTNALSDHHQPEDNRLSSSTDEPDLQRLLEEDGLANESSLKRPRAWRNLASLILARRPRRLQKLGRDDTPFCNAGEKRLPQRRKGRRTLTLCCLGTILSLLGGCLLGIFLSKFFSGDIHQLLGRWGKPGQVGDGLASWPTDFSRGVNPIPCHSHNDYWRLVPLYSAIAAGCISVEADVWLFEDELYVGHSTASLTRNRTLNSLYVEPLLNILSKQNPTTPFHDGRLSLNGVFDTTPEQSLVLLIDFKTPGIDLWPYVLKALSPLRERRYLTHLDGDQIVERPITVIGTGNTPFDMIASKASNPDRDVFFDAPIRRMDEAREAQNPRTLATMDRVRRGAPAVHEGPLLSVRSVEESHNPLDNRDSIGKSTDHTADLSSVLPTVTAELYNTTNSYYASGSFAAIFGRLINNEFSPKQMQLLRDQVRGAHRRGLKARYWELPYWPISLRNYVWEVLVKEGVDMLNVDDLKGATERDWRLPHPWW